MTEKIVVGPLNRGLRNDVTPFNVDNDSFPVLINAYQWRGRVKRKRGTSLLNRLRRFFNSTSTLYNSGSTTITLDGSGNGNILSGFSLEITASISPGTVIITDTVSMVVYTDPSMDGTLSPSGSINYNSGKIIIAASAGNTVTASFNYYPTLPCLGLEYLKLNNTVNPGNLAFDTTYSYNITTASPYSLYDVSFYKNPSTSLDLPGYVRKTVWTPTSWNGENYQQFWTVNYQGALWTTNGVNIPFTSQNIAMQYKPIVAVTVSSGGPPAIVNLQITSHGLVQGDFLFINEVITTTGINFQTGYVTAVVNANNVTVEFPDATIATNGTGGIAQYLTNRSDITKDCLRWYDGDPTNGNVNNPVVNQNKGWVNFCPPLSRGIQSIGDLPAAQYYLVGAKMIVPFKDRLLFVGAVVQTSSANSQVYLQDVVVYSQDGTPYYTSSFTGDPSLATTVFNPILVPQNQTAQTVSYWSDQTGFGGFVQAGLDQAIKTVSSNEDVLIMGFEDDTQVRFVFTGNDIIPFNFYIINSELGSYSTFSAINMDKGVITMGGRGFVMTNQSQARRVDEEILDQIFQVNLQNNGAERICAERDFVNEWIYFTYPSNQSSYVFPTQTLQFNYRDNSWAIFNESYTTYGSFRRVTGYTWATIGLEFPTWASWNEPWNAGSTTLLQEQVIAGNQQGFVVFRDEGTSEAQSLSIQNISFPSSITGATQTTNCVLTCNNQFIAGQRVKITNVTGMTQLNNNTYVIVSATSTTVTLAVNSSGFSAYISGGTATPLEMVYSPNHCLNNKDYIIIEGCLGTISASINGKVFYIYNVSVNGFSIAGTSVPTSGTYLGGGLIRREYRPFIQTRQFPVSWSMGRKTRIGVQQYLLTTTRNSQMTLLIYLSQNSDDPYNDGPIIPSSGSLNNSLIYSTVLYTCPESCNLGLTPFNSSLQMICDISNDGTNASSPQSQIWHRINTSLIGDTVQLGFTLSDEQMSDPNLVNQFAEIELHGFILDVSPSQMLS